MSENTNTWDRELTMEDSSSKFIKDQKAMQRSAHQWVLDACKTFDEIMTGPNKLQEK